MAFWDKVKDLGAAAAVTGKKVGLGAIEAVKSDDGRVSVGSVAGAAVSVAAVAVIGPLIKGAEMLDAYNPEIITKCLNAFEKNNDSQTAVLKAFNNWFGPGKCHDRKKIINFFYEGTEFDDGLSSYDHLLLCILMIKLYSLGLPLDDFIQCCREMDLKQYDFDVRLQACGKDDDLRCRIGDLAERIVSDWAMHDYVRRIEIKERDEQWKAANAERVKQEAKEKEEAAAREEIEKKEEAIRAEARDQAIREERHQHDLLIREKEVEVKEVMKSTIIKKLDIISRSSKNEIAKSLATLHVSPSNLVDIQLNLLVLVKYGEDTFAHNFCTSRSLFKDHVICWEKYFDINETAPLAFKLIPVEIMLDWAQAYENGEGAHKDTDRAIKWYRLASEKGSRKAFSKLRELK